MHMSYWFGTDIGDFLFNGFTITSTPGFISVCFGLLSLAVLFEALNLGLMATKQVTTTTARTDAESSGGSSGEACSLLTTNQNAVQCPPNSRFTSLMYQFIFFVSRDILSYSLMLAIMTFNGYFTIFISLGAGIGFFIFSPLLMEIGVRNNRHKRQPACRHCSAKRKRDGEEERSSLSEVAQGVSEVVILSTSLNGEDRSGSGEEPESSPQLAVVQIHSTPAGGGPVVA